VSSRVGAGNSLWGVVLFELGTRCCVVQLELGTHCSVVQLELGTCCPVGAGVSL
jgi:hypothetical protein